MTNVFQEPMSRTSSLTRVLGIDYVRAFAIIMGSLAICRGWGVMLSTLMLPLR